METIASEKQALDAAGIQRKIASGQLNEALADLLPVLESDPENADANYMAAVCYRYKKDAEKAQGFLNKLKNLSLDKGRVYQEQGHLFRVQNKNTAALTAFRTACQLNPALIASWRAQHELARVLGMPRDAHQANMQLERLAALSKPLVSVIDLISQGRLFKAEALCKQYLQKTPKDTEAMRLLADIALRLGAMDEAEFLLESAIEFSPSNAQLQIDYITVLRRRQKFEASMKATQELVNTDPENPQYQSICAVARLQMGNYEEAVALFDRVIEKLPTDPVSYVSRGHALKTWGKNSEAVHSYKEAIMKNAHCCEAYYALSNLKTYRFDDGELAAMHAVEKSELLTLADEVNLSFTLGKAYEDRQNWQQSFDYYEKGNRIKKQQSGYSAEKMSEELSAQQNFFTNDVANRLGQSGCKDPSPIFIVGLPRAGSTLLEQILSSHSLVDGTLELPNILTMAQKLRRKGKNSSSDYPDVLAMLTSEELYALGQRYIDETKIHRSGAPFFIDKMPNNFRHLGLIKSILPNAKIIDARRHPVACCFSGFKQLFAEGQEFSYSLDDIAQYYNDYVKLMDHWDSVMPGAILRVHYEQVTEDLELQVRRILGYCNLPFEEACLDFYKARRAVRTASSEQVRQPIYKSGVDQWRNFETQLASLVDRLSVTTAGYPC